MEAQIKDETLSRNIFKRFSIGLLFSTVVLYIHTIYCPGNNYPALHGGALIYAIPMAFLFSMIATGVSMFHENKLFVLVYSAVVIILYLFK